MKIKRWISLSVAVELIIDKRLAEMVGDDTLGTYHYAHHLILKALESGSLPAKPESPDLYKFEFMSDSDHHSIPLNDDGTIPTIFWHHLKLTYDEAPGLVTISRDYAEIIPIVRFRQSCGIKDSGVFTGEAGRVLVEKDSLPGQLPKERGERGKGKETGKADQAIIEEAVERILAGEKRAHVVNELAPRMKGASEDAKKTRLRSRLREHPKMKI